MAQSYPQLRDPNVQPGFSTKLTSRGLGLLLMGLAAVIAGFLLPEPKVMVLGLFGLILLGAAWPCARANLRNLEISRSTPDSAFAGQLFPLSISLKNGRRRLDAVAVDFDDGAAGPQEKGLHASWIMAGGTVERRVQTRMLRRGMKHRLRSSIESTFPLGLWRTREEIKDALEMIIYPRPIAPRILDDPEFASMLEADDAESVQFDYSGDFHGLREFQPGDRLKHIDWPATARSSKLMIRQFDKRLPSRFLIVFHSISPKNRGHHGEAFESAMEMLCGLLLRVHDQHIPIDVSASFNGWKLFSMGSRPEDLLEALKMLAGARRAPENDFVNLQRQLGGLDSTQRVFILSDVPVREWEASLPDLPCLTTCLSVSDMRLRQPRIYRKSLSQPAEVPG